MRKRNNCDSIVALISFCHNNRDAQLQYRPTLSLDHVFTFVLFLFCVSDNSLTSVPGFSTGGWGPQNRACS